MQAVTIAVFLVTCVTLAYSQETSKTSCFSGTLFNENFCFNHNDEWLQSSIKKLEYQSQTCQSKMLALKSEITALRGNITNQETQNLISQNKISTLEKAVEKIQNQSRASGINELKKNIAEHMLNHSKDSADLYKTEKTGENTSGNRSRDCADLYKLGSRTDGIYTMQKHLTSH